MTPDPANGTYPPPSARPPAMPGAGCRAAGIILMAAGMLAFWVWLVFGAYIDSCPHNGNPAGYCDSIPHRWVLMGFGVAASICAGIALQWASRRHPGSTARNVAIYAAVASGALLIGSALWMLSPPG